VSDNKWSYIHPDARIHPGVKIEPFCTIYADVEIGEGSIIGPNVTIYDGARIGKQVTIFPGAVISAVPQDLKYNGEKTLTIIGDNTMIRECVTINKGTSYANKTQIGNNCLLMAYTHVAHDCIIGNNCILANNVNLAGHIIIEDFVNIGGVSAVQQFIRIGSYAFVTGGSLVRKDVPPYVKAAREPLAYAGVNTVGLTRRGFDKDQIKRIEDIYRVVFVHHTNLSKAIQVLENEMPESEEKQRVLQFIKTSKDGIIKGIHSVQHADNA
jgi:UDP-N-acetylglucosamine acyltransferase